MSQTPQKQVLQAILGPGFGNKEQEAHVIGFPKLFVQFGKMHLKTHNVSWSHLKCGTRKQFLAVILSSKPLSWHSLGECVETPHFGTF